ncbi:cell division site-positioning protein MapZ family protein [Streptococcus porcinus]
MADEKYTKDIEKDGQTLDIDQAKNMTVGEAVRKDSEIKAGVTDEDSVLDKYIKQHREEVASQKFDTKLSELDDLDTETLDNFIKKQREELAQSGLIDLDEPNENSQKEVSQKEIVVPEKEDNSSPFEPTPLIVPSSTENIVASSERDVPEYFNDETSRQNASKKKLIGILLALLLVVAGLVLGLNIFKGQKSSQTSGHSTSQRSSTKETVAQKAKSDNKAFNNELKAFYMDAEMTKLKNSQFSKIDDLAKKLEKLKDTAYYEEAKGKFDLLKKQIDAIQAVNAKFSTEAIKDGAKVSATIKTAANFDDIKGDILKTGNASLDKLLQSAIADGRKQVEDKAAAEKEKAAKEAEAKASVGNNSGQAAGTENSVSAGANAVGGSAPNLSAQGPAVTYPSASLANIPGLQRDRSRVPYNNAAIADSNNPSWAFNPGVLEKIIATSQARGYFSGNNYYIEPVNIINGNGYYNMFKSDGTYLFSINCKTGYFVGNASGHADALDY